MKLPVVPNRPVEKEPVNRILIAAASPGECKSVLAGLGSAHLEVPELWQAVEVGPHLSVLHTGVGKSNAAGSVSKELGTARNAGNPYSGVISIGVAGSFEPSIGLGSTVLGLQHWMLDEGTVVDRQPGWVSIEEAGWATSLVVPKKGDLHRLFESRVEHCANVGTTSTISGTTSHRDAYLKRAPVKIETMESCSVALVCSMFSVEYVDLRVISNFCGERTADNHDFPGALKKVSSFLESCRSLFPVVETVGDSC